MFLNAQKNKNKNNKQRKIWKEKQGNYTRGNKQKTNDKMADLVLIYQY